MKYTKIENWEYNKNLEGILFFVQIMNESLFDFTLDSYKPKVFNTRLLCEELIFIIGQVKSGIIKEGNLQPIIEELVFNLRNDLIAKELFGNNLILFVDSIYHEKNHDKLKSIVSILSNAFSEGKYLKKLEEILYRKVVSVNQKRDIYTLTRSYITELINLGYDMKYIYHSLNSHFYDWNNKIKDITSLVNFFNFFDFKKIKFDILLKGSKLFSEFQGLDLGVDIEFKNSISTSNFPNSKQFTDFFSSKDENEVYIIFKDIEALDYNSALKDGKYTLNRISNLFNFFHHKNFLKINKNVIITRKSDGNSLILEDTYGTLIKRMDPRPEIGVKNLKEWLLEDQNLNYDSFYRFTRGIDLHAIALESSTIENKLLAFWTSIETLIPKTINSGEDRIIQITNSIIPLLCRDYISNIIKTLIRDLLHWNNKSGLKLINGITLSKPLEPKLLYKTMRFIAMDVNADLRKKFYSELEQYPLLKFRINTLHENFKDTKSSIDAFTMHANNLKWQIMRIYRTRNLIIHAGIVPFQTNLLVENIHTYLDLILETVNELAKQGKVKSIEESIKLQSLLYDNYLKIFNKENVKMNEDNVDFIIDGMKL